MTRIVEYKVRKKDKLFGRLRRSVKGVDREIRAAAEKSAEEVADLAQQWAPRSEGSGSAEGRHYADTIVAREVDTITLGTRRQGGGKSNRNRVTIETRASLAAAWGVFAFWTWRFIEFGTKRTPARPHIFPAYRSLRKRIRGRFSRAINKAIRRSRGG